MSPKKQGLIGFGPNALSYKTDLNRIVHTPMDNLLVTKKIKTNVFGVYFDRMQGVTRKMRNGEVTLGAYDTSRFEGKVLRANLLDYPFNQR